MLSVLVVGGGLGGLCLAQGLRAAGVEVRVFERDASAVVRGQGYRLRIDEQGIAALARCLPDDLLQLFQATTNAPQAPRGLVFDHNLELVAALADSLGATDRRRPSTVANRATLRQILLAGLDDIVHFGHEVVAVHAGGDEVAVEFAGGKVVTGSVLVGADGVMSTVRAQRLPHAEVVESGLRGIYGRAILDRHLLQLLPETLLAGSPRVVGPDGVTLAVGSYRPVESPQRAAARIAPYARLSHVCDYLKWSLVGTPATLGLAEEWLWSASPTELHDAARRITAHWHPALAELVRCADGPAVFALSIRAARPVQPWPTTRITLLGDAIHATTPAGGTGANVALRDAAALTEQLTAADRADIGVLEAIANYEARMREYGFAAATRSLQAAELIFGGRTLTAAG